MKAVIVTSERLPGPRYVPPVTERATGPVS